MAVLSSDIFAQFTAFRAVWPRVRWVVFITGLLFAAIITRIFALGMFGQGI